MGPFAVPYPPNYPTTAEPIFMKFNIWDFYKNSLNRAHFD
jgi:hypothetical protein